MAALTTVAAFIVTLAALVGIALTLLTLPGTWVALGVALMCQLWRPDLYSWWTLGVVLVLCVLAEVAEFLAAAVGAGKAGGTRAGAIWAVIGGFVGGIVGLPFVPPVGTILLGTVGAGLGAILAEHYLSRKGWIDSWRVGRGAGIGRLLSTIVKTGFAVLIAVILIVGAFRSPV